MDFLKRTGKKVNFQEFFLECNPKEKHIIVIPQITHTFYNFTEGSKPDEGNENE